MVNILIDPCGAMAENLLHECLVIIGPDLAQVIPIKQSATDVRFSRRPLLVLLDSRNESNGRESNPRLIDTLLNVMGNVEQVPFALIAVSRPRQEGSRLVERVQATLLQQGASKVMDPLFTSDLDIGMVASFCLRFRREAAEAWLA